MLKGHQGDAFSVSFSPDGTHVLTASNDKTLRVWNADGTELLAILRSPEMEPWSAEFSPSGERIATASHNARNEVTGEMEYWVTVWPRFNRFTGLSDPALWTPANYCPPVEVRTELLGTPAELAAQHLRSCWTRVRAARGARASGRRR